MKYIENVLIVLENIFQIDSSEGHDQLSCSLIEVSGLFYNNNNNNNKARMQFGGEVTFPVLAFLFVDVLRAFLVNSSFQKIYQN
jgi:hypothetical protein